MTTTTHPDAPQGAAPEVEKRIEELVSEYKELEIKRMESQGEQKKKPPLETEITRHICRYLNNYGTDVFYFKIHGQQANQTGRQKVGVPDLYCCVYSRHLWLEVKRPGTGKLSPVQAKVHEEMKRSGAEVYVVTSVEDVKAIIEAGLPERELFEGE